MAILRKTKLKKQAFISVPDVFFSSWWLQKFINNFMKQGKKSLLEQIILRLFIQLKRHWNLSPIASFYKAVIYSKPGLSLVRRRKGKFFINVPVILNSQKQILFAIKTMVLAVRTRKYGSLFSKLIEEFNTKIYRIYPTVYWQTSEILKYNIRVNELPKMLFKKRTKLYKVSGQAKQQLVLEKEKNIRQIVDARVNSRKRWF